MYAEAPASAMVEAGASTYISKNSGGKEKNGLFRTNDLL
jgi:hypothetical protein